MISIHIDKNDIIARGSETLVSGTANTAQVQFHISDHWDAFEKTAVFTNGRSTIAVQQSEWLPGGICPIPHEVLAEAGRIVRVGLRGILGEQTILATPMTCIGHVIPGTNAEGTASSDPSLPIWEQLQRDLGKRSYACSTELEKHRKGAKPTSIRVWLINSENIPADCTLNLYRCVRNRGAAAHWEHPLNWCVKPCKGRQRWGYGLIEGQPFGHSSSLVYPPIPEWMPNNGYMETELPITPADKERGYIDIDLSAYLLPLLKPTDDDFQFSDCGFIGLQRDGRSNCLLMRFRICKDGVPIDEPGGQFRIGIRRWFSPIGRGSFVAQGRLNTSALYTSIC